MTILSLLPVALVLVSSCSEVSSWTEPGSASANPAENRGTRARAKEPGPPLAPESCLGVADTGIFSDLDVSTQLALPAGLTAADVEAVVDTRHSILVLHKGGWPIKVYPLGGPETLAVGSTVLALRIGDAAELGSLLQPANVTTKPSQASAKDLDGDGIPNALDVLIGARKTVENGASYGGGYRRIAYPGGDIPREDGVCTDVVVRAVRNAGLDIQEALQKDIRSSPKSFRMVKKRNPNIDHRRVKTLLPYFTRQWQSHTNALSDKADPLRPGDIIFMDTFPKKSGPDHIGILSNHRGPSGHLLVINNWTDGFKTSEMDLLKFVPVTHRYRLP